MTETEDGVYNEECFCEILNFNADEITDRFVRGDSARNTEDRTWSGDCKELLLNCRTGSLKISTEADLFKADLYLPKSKEMPENGGGYPENL